MTKRLTQWDLLRSLAMFFVLVVHSAPYLDLMCNPSAGTATLEFALICDPVFFALSGYFAIRQHPCSYAAYLWKKFLTVVLPLIIYSVLVYCYAVHRHVTTLSPGNFIRYYQELLTGGWWFIPVLIPFLMLAPWLFSMFEGLGARRQRTLFILVSVATSWGAITTCVSSLAEIMQWSAVHTAVETLALLIPPRVIPGGYFLYFCLGYFVRILPTLFSRRALQKMSALGFALWVLGALAAVFGYKSADPNYLGFFATVGIFYLFDKVRIHSSSLSRFISFVAQRSYSIYLFNYLAVEWAFLNAKSYGLFGVKTPLARFTGLWLWVLAVIAAYCLALICACVADYLMLKPLQRLCKAVFSNVHIRKLPHFDTCLEAEN